MINRIFVKSLHFTRPKTFSGGSIVRIQNCCGTVNVLITAVGSIWKQHSVKANGEKTTRSCIYEAYDRVGAPKPKRFPKHFGIFTVWHPQRNLLPVKSVLVQSTSVLLQNDTYMTNISLKLIEKNI